VRANNFTEFIYAAVYNNSHFVVIIYARVAMVMSAASNATHRSQSRGLAANCNSVINYHNIIYLAGGTAIAGQFAL